MLPNDEVCPTNSDPKHLLTPHIQTEQERLDLQHHLFLLALKGRLYLAPIDNIPLHNVLDLATGTGIWATDFGTTSNLPSPEIPTSLTHISSQYISISKRRRDRLEPDPTSLVRFEDLFHYCYLTTNLTQCSSQLPL